MRLQEWLGIACVLVCVYLDFADSCKCRHCLSADLSLRDNNLIRDKFDFVKKIFPCCDVCRGSEGICGIINSKCGIKKSGTRKKREVSDKGNEKRSKGGEHLRIVNGDDTEKNEYPWMAGIRYKQGVLQGSNRARPFCGGSLIASKWVLIAAKCSFDYQASPPEISVSQIEVILGEHDSSDNYLQTQQSGAKTYDVEFFFIHGDFVDGQVIISPSGVYLLDLSLVSENDIALLKLKTEVDLNKYIPVCLPSPLQNFNQQTATILGWGASKLDQISRPPIFEVPRFLQEVEVTVVERATCANNPVVPGVICAEAGQSGGDTCVLDGGGPLLIPAKNGKVTQYFLAGVTSFSNGCGGPDGSRYADVSYYRSWIVQTLNAEGGATFF